MLGNNFHKELWEKSSMGMAIFLFDMIAHPALQSILAKILPLSLWYCRFERSKIIRFYIFGIMWTPLCEPRQCQLKMSTQPSNANAGDFLYLLYQLYGNIKKNLNTSGIQANIAVVALLFQIVSRDWMRLRL